MYVCIHAYIYIYIVCSNGAVTQQHENMLICKDPETKSARTHAANLFLSRYRFILLQLSLRAVEFARYADICLFTLTLCDHVLDLLDAENEFNGSKSREP